MGASRTHGRRPLYSSALEVDQESATHGCLETSYCRMERAWYPVVAVFTCLYEHFWNVRVSLGQQSSVSITESDAL